MWPNSNLAREPNDVCIVFELIALQQRCRSIFQFDSVSPILFFRIAESKILHEWLSVHNIELLISEIIRFAQCFAAYCWIVALSYSVSMHLSFFVFYFVKKYLIYFGIYSMSGSNLYRDVTELNPNFSWMNWNRTQTESINTTRVDYRLFQKGWRSKNICLKMLLFSTDILTFS